MTEKEMGCDKKRDRAMMCSFVESLYIPKNICMAMMLSDGKEIPSEDFWFHFRQYLLEKAEKYLEST